ncbi:MAG: FeoA family protein [Bacillota bacterium]|nr:FeoA family protein [Bacillota bacterium]MDW7683742.1 FeoA family protein [Bacillota bacterium]
MDTRHGHDTLVSLCVGQRGVVTSLAAEGIGRRRMLDLGLVPGTVVESVRRSPAGDPTAYIIRGAVIALRSEESRKIFVNLL